MAVWLVILISSVLSGMVIAQSAFLARKKRIGWAIGVASSVLAIPYDLLTYQYGYIALSVVSVIIGVYAYMKWR